MKSSLILSDQRAFLPSLNYSKLNLVVIASTFLLGTTNDGLRSSMGIEYLLIQKQNQATNHRKNNKR
jgi:hypothetical protein